MANVNDYRNMNPIIAGALAERNFELLMEELQPGYERCSTFAADFAIADSFGKAAVKDTFLRAFNEWKDHSHMMAEMALVLNHNIWRYYEMDPGLAKVYDECWRQADEYCMEHYKGDDLDWESIPDARHPMMELHLRLPKTAPRLSILRKRR